MIQTAESVTRGHPDKVADQISDAILDEHLRRDPHSRVAVETLVKGDQVVLAGEVRGHNAPSEEERAAVVRETLAAIGYSPDVYILDLVAEQSPEIAGAVDGAELGAGDQGIMYGYATSETHERLPLAQVLARDITDLLTEYRETDSIGWLQPDGKSQVTVRDGRPRRIVVSACHREDAGFEEVKDALQALVEDALLARGFDPSDVDLIANPAGPWTFGGAAADAGVTGRKLMVDSYGGVGRHGGGAFSGKDPSKVDRSAAYAARQAARWLVDEAGLPWAEVSLAYAIGQAQPVMVEVSGPPLVPAASLRQHLFDRFDFRPAAIIDRLDLLKPHYLGTAARGHFGRPEYPWERGGSPTRIW